MFSYARSFSAGSSLVFLLAVCPLGFPVVCLSIHLFVCPSIPPSVRLLARSSLSFYPSICPSFHPFVCQFACRSDRVFVLPSVPLHIYLSVHLSLGSPAPLSVACSSLGSVVCRLACPFIQLSTLPSSSFFLQLVCSSVCSLIYRLNSIRLSIRPSARSSVRPSTPLYVHLFVLTSISFLVCSPSSLPVFSSLLIRLFISIYFFPSGYLSIRPSATRLLCPSVRSYAQLYHSPFVLPVSVYVQKWPTQ